MKEAVRVRACELLKGAARDGAAEEEKSSSRRQRARDREGSACGSKQRDNERKGPMSDRPTLLFLCRRSARLSRGFWRAFFGQNRCLRCTNLEAHKKTHENA
jgi:hypothetical protein